MQNRRPSPMLCGALMTLAALSLPAQAQIYKYQDAQGNWHFTDRPPPSDAGNAQTLEAPPASTTASGDVAQELRQHFDPQSPVEEAALAVVAINTPLGSGSGFFVSTDGYLLTNKHVVKPMDTAKWQELQEAVDKKEDQFREARDELARERSKLAEMKASLDDYERAMDLGLQGHARRTADAEYAMFKDRYDRHAKALAADERRIREKEKEFEKAKSELSWKRDAATLRNRFTLVLKDNSEIQARLVAVSSAHDLALLKADGKTTPALSPANRSELTQGMRVLAIGSPLGFRDSITSGILTRLEGDRMVTDATILPGNSGGPLITEDGHVIGINTVRVSEVKGGQGFGIAIPLSVAASEFSDQLGDRPQ